MDALVFFTQAFAILVAISVILHSGRWVKRRIDGNQILVDMNIYQGLIPDKRKLIDEIPSVYGLDHHSCQGFTIVGNKITFRMLLKNADSHFYITDRSLPDDEQDVAFEMVTIPMKDPKQLRRHLRKILR